MTDTSGQNTADGNSAGTGPQPQPQQAGVVVGIKQPKNLFNSPVNFKLMSSFINFKMK